MDSVTRQLRKITVTEKFMADWDPIKSKREERKKGKVMVKRNKSGDNNKKLGELYDGRGVHIATDIDICDCLNDKCEGCFFPCRKCKSEKCGNECRNRRKYVVMEVCEQMGMEPKRVWKGPIEGPLHFK